MKEIPYTWHEQSTDSLKLSLGGPECIMKFLISSQQVKGLELTAMVYWTWVSKYPIHSDALIKLYCLNSDFYLYKSQEISNKLMRTSYLVCTQYLQYSLLKIGIILSMIIHNIDV